MATRQIMTIFVSSQLRHGFKFEPSIEKISPGMGLPESNRLPTFSILVSPACCWQRPSLNHQIAKKGLAVNQSSGNDTKICVSIRQFNSCLTNFSEMNQEF